MSLRERGDFVGRVQHVAKHQVGEEEQGEDPQALYPLLAQHPDSSSSSWSELKLHSPSPPPRQSPSYWPRMDASTTKAAFAILSWYGTNIFTVVLNKYLFQMINFTFPLTLTAIHMLVCSIGSVFVLRLFKLVPLIPIERQKLISHVVPLAAIFCLNIILGNISLRWIPVSFMQTVKSLVPAFTVLLQVIFFRQPSPTLIYLSLVPVVGGVGLASFTEVNFNVTGFTTALVASLTTSIQSIVSSLILTGPMRLDSVNMVYYMAPVSFILIVPFAFFYEYTRLLEYDHTMYGFNYVAAVLLTSGAVAYLLNICTFFAIKSTSPLTFTVFGNLKVVVVIIISVLIFRNEVTIMNGIGCVVAIIGIIWYNSIEYQIKEEKKRKSLALEKETPFDKATSPSNLRKSQEVELESILTSDKTDD